MIPVRFEETWEKLLWDDGSGTEQLILLSDQFAHALTECQAGAIEQTALTWAATFPAEEPLSSTLPYQAVFQLQKVAHDAIGKKQALIYHIEGAPQFFEYLQYL